MTIGTEPQLAPGFVVDLSVSEEWTTFDPRNPADEVEALSQFDVLTDLIDRYAAPDAQAEYHRTQDLAHVAFDALCVAEVSLLATWGRLVVNDDRIEPLAGWFTVAVRDTPGAPSPDLAVERNALIADGAAAEPVPGQAVMVSVDEVELTAGLALRIVWEVRPPDGAEHALGFRTTEYMLPIGGSAARALLTCSCPLSDFTDTWDEVFLSVANSMKPRPVGPNDVVPVDAGGQ